MFRRSADHHNPLGQAHLGFAYYEGHGVPKDYVEAAKWFQRSADQGAPLGLLLIGKAYEVGLGVPQDYVRAHVWLNLAAARADPASEGEKDMQLVASSTRDALAAKMTPTQVEEAQTLAREWKPTNERLVGLSAITHEEKK
jgi:hypothetical protein